MNNSITRFFLAFQAFNIPAPLPSKLLNLCIALRWHTNTAKYITYVGAPPNYVKPRLWTEKMQWRKLYDRNPVLTTFSDKLAVREYVKEFAPEIEFPKFLWVGKTPAKIPFDSFDEPYVVKTSHSCGKNIFVPDPAKSDRLKIVSSCKKWLKKPHGRNKGEWGYKNVHPRVIVEQLLSQKTSAEPLVNYKFFVFENRVRFVQLESYKASVYFLTFFDRDGQRLPIRKWIGRLPSQNMPKPDTELNAPANFSAMVRAAEKLGQDIEQIRVDLYSVDDRILFSELTPYDGSGYSYLYQESEKFKVRPSFQLNDEYGAYWKLPSISSTKGVLKALIG